MPRILKINLILTLATLVMVGFAVGRPQAQEINPLEDTAKLQIIQGNSILANSPLPYLKVARTIKVITTAYSSTPEQTDNDPFVTAAGTGVRDGIVANNLLPFGTKIRIPELYGDKIFVVEDRMSWKKGNYHVDIWFASLGEAKNFGAKFTYVEVLEN